MSSIHPNRSPHRTDMADRKSFEMGGENNRENGDRTNIKMIVAIIVAIIVIFIIGFVFGYFIRKPSTSKSECPRSSGAPDKTEQHQMFKNGVNAEKLEENMR